jgi:hypothetical protein
MERWKGLEGKMVFDVRRVDLGKLNSLTKYPSILTYHALGEKGALREAIQVPFTGRVIGTEKVDGTNARLIFCPDGCVLVGSREDLLWERRDLIGNPSLGIVEAVKDAVQRLHGLLCQEGHIVVYYAEVFGRGVGSAAKHYTKEGRVGFRLFDVAVIEDYEELLGWPADTIARWRDQGGQRYADADRLVRLAEEAGLEPVPALFDGDASQLPTGLEEVYRFLLGFGSSRCRLDGTADGMPEGVVVRSPDRTAIAKLRREDYERTLKRGRGKT